MKITHTWYSSLVFHGDQSGRTIGFPTINLDPTTLPSDTEHGVYAAVVRVHEKQYIGALYLGPRLVKGEKHTVLEIFILDFSEEIYDQKVSFCLQKFIRPVLDFKSLEALKKQLQHDITAVKLSVAENNQSLE